MIPFYKLTIYQHLFQFTELRMPSIPPIGVSPRSNIKQRQPNTPDTSISTVSKTSNETINSPVASDGVTTPNTKRVLENYQDMDVNSEAKKNSNKLSLLEVPWMDYDELCSYLQSVHPEDTQLLAEASHVHLVEYGCADYTLSDLKMLLGYFGVHYGKDLKDLKTDGHQSKKNITIQIRDLLTAGIDNSGKTAG